MCAAIETEMEIAAAREVVWKILSDLPAYPSWNPSIARLEGRLTAGERLRLQARLPTGIRIRVRPIVSQFVPLRAFSWKAVLIAPLFFSAEHRFALEDRERGVRLIQSEQFAGLLGPLFVWTFGPALRRAYETVNLHLKQQAENAADRTHHRNAALR